jgi:hypothetical protein
LFLSPAVSVQDAQEVSVYQLDFFTPGIIPESAISRKQIRHMPNFRRTALERPQRWQRCCLRALNFGFCFDFSTNDLGAI